MTKQIVLVMASAPIPHGKPDSHWHYVLLKELIARGHEVSAFIACETQSEIEQTQAIFPPSDYNVRCYSYRKPQLLGKWRSFLQPHSYAFDDALCQALTERLSLPYDVLHLEQLWTGWVGLKTAQKSVVTLHYLFSEDQTFRDVSDWRSKFYGWLSCRAEQHLLKSFSYFIALSDRLAKSVYNANHQANIHTIPLGINLAHYPFALSKSGTLAPVVGLIGNFNWAPSFSAAERLLTRLWAEIKRQVPNAQLQIIGRSARTRLVAFENQPDITLHQDVPDIVPYFHQIDVLLYAPMAGSGMKVKVMEAFALGTAVVTTSEGVEGLPAEDGVHAGICEHDAGLIQRTVELLINPVQRKTQSCNARQLLEQVCSPSATVSQVEQVYDAVMEANR